MSSPSVIALTAFIAWTLLLRSADRRLQLGKRDGRNRVVARDI
jgi:hypothetical protein